MDSANTSYAEFLDKSCFQNVGSLSVTLFETHLFVRKETPLAGRPPTPINEACSR